MKTGFQDAIKHRRSYYSISNSSPVSDDQIEQIVEFAIRNTPSAFNSQSTRVVLLLGENHKKLWNITLEALQKIVPSEVFASSKSKIDSFAAGYGTVLYFEEQKVVEQLQEQFALYADNFPGWSIQTSAMHQLVIWTMLEDAGFGASLQHYNPLIDNQVKSQWKLPESWRLIAQMPFGTPIEQPGEKSFQPVEQRIKIFK